MGVIPPVLNEMLEESLDDFRLYSFELLLESNREILLQATSNLHLLGDRATSSVLTPAIEENIGSTDMPDSEGHRGD